SRSVGVLHSFPTRRSSDLRRSPVDRKKDAWEGRLSTRRTFVGQLLNSVRRIRGHLAGWDDLAGSAGGGMNSMLEDVLAREGSAPAFEDSRVDVELEEMLSKMRTNIKIIDLGGEGCNTIGRVYGEG